jgi:hypothetical protein
MKKDSRKKKKKRKADVSIQMGNQLDWRERERDDGKPMATLFRMAE